jgi:hypothetical protein
MVSVRLGHPGPSIKAVDDLAHEPVPLTEALFRVYIFQGEYNHRADSGLDRDLLGVLAMAHSVAV